MLGFSEIVVEQPLGISLPERLELLKPSRRRELGVPGHALHGHLPPPSGLTFWRIDWT
jgi:hypothetical protein